MTNIHPVILSGGTGTRLWPRSRSNTPKQFLPLAGDETLFQQTARRASHVVGAQPPIVVCAEDHRFVVGEQLQAIGQQAASILLEPSPRNTAPAIAAAALWLSENVASDALMLVLPADHLVSDVAAFCAAIERGADAACEGELVTLGIVPTAPETGYGYIRIGESLNEGVHRIAKFVEKPNADVASEYVASGEYLWNAGMFLMRADRYLEELALHAPKMLSAVREAMNEAKRDLDFLRLDAAAFEKAPSDSIDYAVMEKTDRAAVVPVDCGWSDIGAWSALWEVARRDAEGNAKSGDVIAVDAYNNYLQASEHRMIAALGIEDMVVVDTADAVLVAKRERVQDVKALVDQLKAQGRTEHLHHRKVYRPWGSYDSLASGDRFQVKRIVVNPGASLSLQRHFQRAEHWIVVEGTAEVTCGDKVFLLHENQSTFIPLGEVHRLRNPGRTPVELIEVQSGSYLGEDDIERLEDVYGRIEGS